MPVVLVLGVLTVNLAYIKQVLPASLPLGDPPGLNEAALLNETSPFGELEAAPLDEEVTGFNFIEQGALVNPASPGEVAPALNNIQPVVGKDSRKKTTLTPGLPSTDGYFTLPVKGGWNSGRLHGKNGVDILTSCGAPIYAASAGRVTDAGTPFSWNGGYGGYIKISHPNGMSTLYAHNETNSVSPGDEVGQGAVIGSVGRTGNVQGSCHVHFEVLGGQNPFVR